MKIYNRLDYGQKNKFTILRSTIITMINRLTKIISGNHNEKEIAKLQKIVEQINHHFALFDKLSDKSIQAKTNEFKTRIAEGETLDDILPQAFALVKQAAKRLVGKQFNVRGETVTWNMIHYDVQLLGGLILHQGKIAEMRTGEGKTLVGSLPTYLNALAGKGVHVVTVNDYLAARDAAWMKPLYEFLGLTVGVVVKGVPLNQRREQYACDITYVENSELGFDYLRDNLVKSIEERVLSRRPLNYAIIDEIDSILIDEARTPLIISEPDQTATDKYEYYAKIVKTLKPSKFKKKVSKGFLKEMISTIKEEEQEQSDDGDYYIDEKTKTASLSSFGIAKLEKTLGVHNLYQDFGYQEIHHIENALKASAVYHQDKDYIISGGEILIVDQNTGRAMQGRRFGQGLHQAIEAKHSLQIQKESKTLATVTYQNFFKNYTKLSGMTGTAATEGEEFDKIYNLEVLILPTNKPLIRVDLGDKVYFNQTAKWKFILDHVKFAHRIGQPILIGTSSIHTSELMSSLLKKANLTHAVLNAKMHEKEAHIVSNAGKYKSLMVATNMAGRGTDIKLDKTLNPTLAKNYAAWIEKTLNGKHMEQDGQNAVSAVVFSQTECDRTLEAIAQHFGLTDQQIIHAAKDRISMENGHRIKITYNNKKKEPQDAFAEIVITPADTPNAEVIQRNFHYGLCIIGTEKHDSRRIDNQLRGRAGRQGDAGISVFYVALDDEIMKKMGGQKIQAFASMMLPKEEREKLELTQKQFTSSIIRAQKQMEGWYFGIRKHLFDYDSVINKQRIRVYEKRDSMLFALQDIQKEIIENKENNKSKTDNAIKNIQDSSHVLEEVTSFVEPVVSDFIQTHIHLATPTEQMIQILQKEFNLHLQEDFFAKDNYTTLIPHLQKHIIENIQERAANTKHPLLFNTVITRIFLNIIDRNWIEHIDAMQSLRDKVGLMGYAKQDPLVMYKKEAYDKYTALRKNIQQTTLVTIMNTDFEKIEAKQEEIETKRQQAANQNLLGKLKNATQGVELPTGQRITSPIEQQSNFTGKKAVLQDEDGTEVFEVEDTQANATAHVVKSKLRPNDKVTIKYTDGKIAYDVKYKKVKKDIDEGKATIIG